MKIENTLQIEIDRIFTSASIGLLQEKLTETCSISIMCDKRNRQLVIVRDGDTQYMYNLGGAYIPVGRRFTEANNDYTKVSTTFAELVDVIIADFEEVI